MHNLYNSTDLHDCNWIKISYLAACQLRRNLVCSQNVWRKYQGYMYALVNENYTILYIDLLLLSLIMASKC